MAEQKQKKNRLAEVFTKDYKYEGLVLLVLSIIAIILGVYFLVECYTLDGDSYRKPFGDTFLLGQYDREFSWLLTGLGVISLLLSIWPYYKPSVYEIKRVSWPTKKTMFENVLSAFIFTIIFVVFFAGIDLGLKVLIEWVKSWGLYL